MLNTASSMPDAGSIITALNQNGYCVVKDFFSNAQCDQVIGVFDSIISNQNDVEGIRHHNLPGYSQVYSDAWDVSKTETYLIGKHNELILECCHGLFGDELLRYVSSKYLSENEKSVFAVRFSYSQTKETFENNSAIPFVPHYDRIQYLKFYVYLETVSKEGGALSIADRVLIKETNKARQKQIDNGSKDCYEIHGDDLNEFSINMKSVEGEKGTLVIYDGAQPHAHGKITNGKVRKVLQMESQRFSELSFGYNEALAKNVANLKNLI